MNRFGLLVRLDARPGKEAEVEEFLNSALPIVKREAGTTAWFAVCFDEGEYGIFDAFPDEAARDAHLNGPVARALMARADELLSRPPVIRKLDVLADKLPEYATDVQDTKGLLMTFKAKEGRHAEVERFLQQAQPMMEHESRTTAWFAIHTDDDEYGVFDVFPDNRGRNIHLAGRMPREIARHALDLLGSVPDLHMLNVQAEKLGSPRFAI